MPGWRLPLTSCDTSQQRFLTVLKRKGSFKQCEKKPWLFEGFVED